MKKTIYYKVLAVFVAVTFFTTQIASAAHAVYTIQISEDQGNVAQRYKGESDKVIIHIQDAHSNLDAQVNLAKIICSLIPQIAEDDNPFVGIEGAIGGYDLKELRDFPLKNVSEIVGRDFVKEGKFIGAEYASMISERNFTLFGLEDTELFRKDYDAFYHVSEKQDDIEQAIQEIEEQIEELKELIYGGSLKKFDAHASAYETRDMELVAFLQILYPTIDDLGIDLMRYMSLMQFKEVFVLERSIDYKMLDVEIEKLTQEIITQQPTVQGETDESIQQLYLDYKGNAITQKEMVFALINIAVTRDINLLLFPNIDKLTRYYRKFALIDFNKLLREILSLNTEIRNKLALSKDENLLIDLWRIVVVVKQLVTLKVVREDVDQFRRERMKYSLPFIYKGLEILAERNGLSVALTRPEINFEDILAVADEFYTVAEERNEAMLTNLLSEMDRTGQKVGVLVAGGFHTDGIVDMFRERDISYITITPRIDELGENVAYMDRMMGNIAPVGQFLSSRLNSSMQILNEKSFQTNIDNAAVLQMAGIFLDNEGNLLLHEQIETHIAQLQDSGESDLAEAAQGLMQDIAAITEAIHNNEDVLSEDTAHSNQINRIRLMLGDKVGDEEALVAYLRKQRNYHSTITALDFSMLGVPNTGVGNFGFIGLGMGWDINSKQIVEDYYTNTLRPQTEVEQEARPDWVDNFNQARQEGAKIPGENTDSDVIDFGGESARDKKGTIDEEEPMDGMSDFGAFDLGDENPASRVENSDEIVQSHVVVSSVLAASEGIKLNEETIASGRSEADSSLLLLFITKPENNKGQPRESEVSAEIADVIDFGRESERDKKGSIDEEEPMDGMGDFGAFDFGNKSSTPANEAVSRVPAADPHSSSLPAASTGSSILGNQSVAQDSVAVSTTPSARDIANVAKDSGANASGEIMQSSIAQSGRVTTTPSASEVAGVDANAVNDSGISMPGAVGRQDHAGAKNMATSQAATAGKISSSVNTDAVTTGTMGSANSVQESLTNTMRAMQSGEVHGALGINDLKNILPDVFQGNVTLGENAAQALQVGDKILFNVDGIQNGFQLTLGANNEALIIGVDQNGNPITGNVMDIYNQLGTIFAHTEGINFTTMDATNQGHINFGFTIGGSEYGYQNLFDGTSFDPTKGLVFGQNGDGINAVAFAGALQSLRGVFGSNITLADAGFQTGNTFNFNVGAESLQLTMDIVNGNQFNADGSTIANNANGALVNVSAMRSAMGALQNIFGANTFASGLTNPTALGMPQGIGTHALTFNVGDAFHALSFNSTADAPFNAQNQGSASAANVHALVNGQAQVGVAPSLTALSTAVSMVHGIFGGNTAINSFSSNVGMNSLTFNSGNGLNTLSFTTNGQGQMNVNNATVFMGQQNTGNSVSLQTLVGTAQTISTLQTALGASQINVQGISSAGQIMLGLNGTQGSVPISFEMGGNTVADIQNILDGSTVAGQNYQSIIQTLGNANANITNVLLTNAMLNGHNYSALQSAIQFAQGAFGLQNTMMTFNTISDNGSLLFNIDAVSGVEGAQSLGQFAFDTVNGQGQGSITGLTTIENLSSMNGIMNTLVSIFGSEQIQNITFEAESIQGQQTLHISLANGTTYGMSVADAVATIEGVAVGDMHSDLMEQVQSLSEQHGIGVENGITFTSTIGTLAEGEGHVSFSLGGENYQIVSSANGLTIASIDAIMGAEANAGALLGQADSLGRLDGDLGIDAIMGAKANAGALSGQADSFGRLDGDLAIGLADGTRLGEQSSLETILANAREGDERSIGYMETINYIGSQVSQTMGAFGNDAINTILIGNNDDRAHAAGDATTIVVSSELIERVLGKEDKKELDLEIIREVGFKSDGADEQLFSKEDIREFIEENFGDEEGNVALKSDATREEFLKRVGEVEQKAVISKEGFIDEEGEVSDEALVYMFSNIIKRVILSTMQSEEIEEENPEEEFEEALTAALNLWGNALKMFDLGEEEGEGDENVFGAVKEFIEETLNDMANNEDGFSWSNVIGAFSKIMNFINNYLDLDSQRAQKGQGYETDQEVRAQLAGIIGDAMEAEKDLIDTNTSEYHLVDDDAPAVVFAAVKQEIQQIKENESKKKKKPRMIEVVKMSDFMKNPAKYKGAIFGIGLEDKEYDSLKTTVRETTGDNIIIRRMPKDENSVEFGLALLRFSMVRYDMITARYKIMQNNAQIKDLKGKMEDATDTVEISATIAELEQKNTLLQDHVIDKTIFRGIEYCRAKRFNHIMNAVARFKRFAGLTQTAA
ncbi:hypothetical protein N9934_00535 [Desulfosarcina sp.]|nr:hypothetical protein [Desulfosarcina sp.]